MKILLLITLLVLSFSALAYDGHSMRRCSLLPITDSVGGVLGSKVFEGLELYLKEGTWCQYQSNSDLLTVFSRYRQNLPQHLKTPQVVRVVADKLHTGSNIRVSLVSEINGVEVHLDVVAGDGETILYSERSLLAKDDLEIATQTVRNWLEVYGKTIPYDGKITGILGDQITVDHGKGYPVKIGQDFTVLRYRAVKKHPLLKKVVDWDTAALATGKIFSISEDQTLGIVKVYKSENKLQTGDWVRLEPLRAEQGIDTSKYPEDEKDSFGKLGMASVYGSLASSSLRTSTSTGKERLSGLLYGFQGRAEAWVTRSYFGMIELGRSLGTLKNTTYQRGSFKLGGGWKYLPLGFFYGPQVDVFGGYASHLYKADYDANDGTGEFGMSGIFLGAGTNFPVGRQYRAVLRAEILPFPNFSDTDSVYGSVKTRSWLQLEAGVKYLMSSNLTIDGIVEMSSTKATFKGAVKSVSAQDTALKFGASFNF